MLNFSRDSSFRTKRVFGEGHEKPPSRGRAGIFGTRTFRSSATTRGRDRTQGQALASRSRHLRDPAASVDELRTTTKWMTGRYPRDRRDWRLSERRLAVLASVLLAERVELAMSDGGMSDQRHPARHAKDSLSSNWALDGAQCDLKTVDAE